jgi:hypothetical protein
MVRFYQYQGLPSSGFGSGGGAGRGFFAVLEAGLDMPKLRRNKWNPLRSASSMGMVQVLSGSLFSAGSGCLPP